MYSNQKNIERTLHLLQREEHQLKINGDRNLQLVNPGVNLDDTTQVYYEYFSLLRPTTHVIPDSDWREFYNLVYWNNEYLLITTKRDIGLRIGKIVLLELLLRKRYDSAYNIMSDESFMKHILNKENCINATKVPGQTQIYPISNAQQYDDLFCGTLFHILVYHGTLRLMDVYVRKYCELEYESIDAMINSTNIFGETCFKVLDRLKHGIIVSFYLKNIQVTTSLLSVQHIPLMPCVCEMYPLDEFDGGIHKMRIDHGVFFYNMFCQPRCAKCLTPVTKALIKESLSEYARKCVPEFDNTEAVVVDGDIEYRNNPEAPSVSELYTMYRYMSADAIFRVYDAENDHILNIPSTTTTNTAETPKSRRIIQSLYFWAIRNFNLTIIEYIQVNCTKYHKNLGIEYGTCKFAISLLRNTNYISGLMKLGRLVTGFETLISYYMCEALRVLWKGYDAVVESPHDYFVDGYSVTVLLPMIEEFLTNLHFCTETMIIPVPNTNTYASVVHQSTTCMGVCSAVLFMLEEFVMPLLDGIYTKWLKSNDQSRRDLAEVVASYHLNNIEVKSVAHYYALPTPLIYYIKQSIKLIEKYSENKYDAEQFFNFTTTIDLELWKLICSDLDGYTDYTLGRDPLRFATDTSLLTNVSDLPAKRTKYVY